MKNINITYLLPELKGASGGAKVIYNHSITLNNLNNNLTSNITHIKKKISYKLETSLSKKIKIINKIQKVGWDANKMKVSENFTPDTKWFNKKIKLGKNLKFEANRDFVIIPEIWSHFAVDLNLVTSNVDLSGLEVETAGDSRRAFKLKDELGSILNDSRGLYDYILVDCPPSLSLLTIMALVASDALVVPLQTEFFALEGLTQLMKTIERKKSNLNPS